MYTSGNLSLKNAQPLFITVFAIFFLCEIKERKKMFLSCNHRNFVNLLPFSSLNRQFRATDKIFLKILFLFLISSLQKWKWKWQRVTGLGKVTSYRFQSNVHRGAKLQFILGVHLLKILNLKLSLVINVCSHPESSIVGW